MNTAMNNDVYFKKIIEFHAWKQRLEFKVSQDLFSSFDIDQGTKFLLRSIVEANYQKPETILDLGCGYGPIGLTLKSMFKDCTVHMVDIDALAVEYSRQNAKLNGLSGVEVYASLGYDDVKRTDFNLIVSNIPGKTGEPVIKHFLTEAAHFLVPNGIVAIVIVTPLESFVENVLGNTPGIEILQKRTRPGHSVFHYRFNNAFLTPRLETSAFARGIYDRTEFKFQINNLEIPMRVAANLPEFDTLSYNTELISNGLFEIRNMRIRRAVVFNPDQGHLGVIIWKLFQPDKIALVDRNLLALRYSKLNLILNKCPDEKIEVFHQIDMDLVNISEVDLFAIRLREENREANLLMIKQASEKLAKSGLIIAAGSSTGISRLCDDIEPLKFFRIKERERWRGNSLLILQYK